MTQPEFKHYDLQLVEPAFDSPLTDLIIELNYLKKKRLGGTTPAPVFFNLKSIFHMMESIGSARIEGNNTSLLEYIETKIEEKTEVPIGVKEIQNIESAMDFIEKNVKNHPINRAFVNEIHKIVVDELPTSPKGEGDKTPGQYRKYNVQITKSKHLPPDWMRVDEYMNELLDFINQDKGPKFDLLKTAIAHHRFVWIHPFGNGNGRTVRLFTYAMLIKLGFNVDVGRIINPTAIFCNHRNNYVKYLELADTGGNSGILDWCEYVLRGLKEEIEKIDKLLDYDFLAKEILVPTINLSIERKYITDIEAKILKKAIDKKVIQSNDLKDILQGRHSTEPSRQIRKLVDKKMLQRLGFKDYVISFGDNYLLRGVISVLGEKGFLPHFDEKS
ncbi:MAG: Fic family protein [Rhabdochlamydiaceae bacterium]|nr:Fic family protein [Rhabdochlamydiaceae bacterium]